MGKGKIKRLKKRLFSGLLAAFVATSTVSVTYYEAQAEAVTMTWGIIEVLQAIFASVGVTYMTSEMLTRDYWTDGANALDDDWSDIYDSMEESYEKQWTVINGGGGSGGDPTPTPDPDDDDKKTIPHFAELVRGAQTAGMLSFSAETYACILPWLQKTLNASYNMGQLICDKTMPDGLNVDLDYIKDNVVLMFHTKNSMEIYPYTDADESKETISIYPSNCYNFVLSYSGAFCFGVNSSNQFVNGAMYSISDPLVRCFDSAGNYIAHRLTGLGKVTSFDLLNGKRMYRYNRYNVIAPGSSGFSYIANCPIVSSDAEALEYFNNYEEDNNKNKEPIWTTPELQDSFENNGTLELPSLTPEPINLPSIDNIADLAEKLNPETNPDLNPDNNPDPGTIPDLIADYINNLKPQVDPDPEPSPEPDPDPTTTPEPTATPSPDEPDTDNSKFLADLKSLFPFCIPFDLIHAFDVLNVPGEAPVFDFPFKLDYGEIHIDEHWKIDFSDYESVVQILRVIETLGFIISLIVVTRNLIKG